MYTSAQAKGNPDSNGNTIRGKVIRGGTAPLNAGGYHKSDNWRERFNTAVTKRIEDAETKLRTRTAYPRFLCKQ